MENVNMLAEGPVTTVGVSIVVPAYNESETIEGMCVQLTDVMMAGDEDYELLFVDDGSTDDTWEKISRLAADDPRVHAIRHRRNFGKASALANGFDYARGEIVVITDADMQYDTCDVPRLIAEIRAGWDVATAYKVLRRDPLGKRLASKVFNFFVRRATGVRFHDMNAGLKAFTREAARHLVPYSYGELHRFYVVLAVRNGFKVTEVPVESLYRTAGKSKYGLERYLRGALDFVTVLFLSGYSETPMHALGGIGLGFAGLGTFALLATTLVAGIADRPIVSGPSLVISQMLVITGALFFVTGLLAEMINNLERRATGHHRIAEVRGIERRSLVPEADVHFERRRRHDDRFVAPAETGDTERPGTKAGS